MAEESHELEHVLAKLRACAAAPLEQATAMPPELYSSPALYDRELKEIFAKEWLSPGRAADIPNPGDYISFAINDQPILSIRGVHLRFDFALAPEVHASS